MESSPQSDKEKWTVNKAARADNGLKKPVSNLLLRIITGVIIAFFTVVIAYWGGLVFRFFCFCVGVAVLYEWNSIITVLQTMRGRLCAGLCFLLPGIALLIAAPPLYVFAAFFAGLCLCYGLVRAETGARAAIFQAAGFVYATLFPLGFVFLREGLAHGAEAGLYWLLFLYITVWASDIGAYSCGRLCGGPKLAPKISPNKTWSGAIGGAVSAILGACCFTFLLRQQSILTEGSDIMAQPIPFSLIIALAFLLSVIAQIGDLAESVFKRHFGVKDSGRLLPGHGGIMDRIDGLLPACIVLVGLLAVTDWGFS